MIQVWGDDSRQGLLKAEVLTFEIGSFFVVEKWPVHCNMLCSISGFYLLDFRSIPTLPPQVLTTKNVSRHCQMSPADGMGKSYWVENHSSRLTAKAGLMTQE